MESSNHQQQNLGEWSSKAVSKPQTSGTQVIYLPTEIISNILSRLSVAKVLQLRSVCKVWSDLTSTDAFIHEHLVNFDKNETNHDYVETQVSYNKCTVKRRSQNRSRSIKISHRPTNMCFFRDYCNGLVLVCDLDDNASISIINPAIDDKFVKLPDIGMTKALTLAVHLCHDRHSNKYKVIRFFLVGQHNQTVHVEILTLGDDSWKQLGEIPERIWGRQVNIYGAMHWMTMWEKTIFSFKIADESFDFIECPARKIGVDDKGKDVLVEYEGCLCIARWHWHPWIFSLFFMIDYSNQVWIEQVIDLTQIRVLPFSCYREYGCLFRSTDIISHNGKLIFKDDDYNWYSSRRFYAYNPKTRTLEEYKGEPPDRHPEYKESLISARKICYGANYS